MIVTGVKKESAKHVRFPATPSRIKIRERRRSLEGNALYLTEIFVESHRPPMTAPAVQMPWPMMVPNAIM